MLFNYADQVMSWYIKGREQELSEVVLEKGFSALKNELQVKSDEDWKVLFDNFVVYSGLIVLLVVKNIDFFIELLRSKGGAKVREILQISDQKYDDVWKVVLDAILDGYCKKKYREKRLETVSETLDEILAILDFYSI